MTKRDVLPASLPPRGLSRVYAAAYIGVSVSFFDTLVAEGRMPQPKRINSRKLWDRLALDAAFEALPGDEEPDTWADVLTRSSPEKLARREQPENPFQMPSREDFEKLGPSPVFAAGALWSRDEWNAHVRARPISKLEKKALRAMGLRGAEHIFGGGDVPCGLTTAERLLAREYIVVAVDRGPQRVPDYRLTDAGLEAFRRLPADE